MSGWEMSFWPFLATIHIHPKSFALFSKINEFCYIAVVIPASKNCSNVLFSLLPIPLWCNSHFCSGPQPEVLQQSICSQQPMMTVCCLNSALCLYWLNIKQFCLKPKSIAWCMFVLLDGGRLHAHSSITFSSINMRTGNSITWLIVWVAMGSDILIGKAIGIQCAYFSSITQNKTKSKVE